MKGQLLYCQCKITKQIQAGIRIQVAWIPQKYAKKGKILKIGDSDGWKVTEVYETQTEQYVKDRERAYKHWRRATDI